MKTLFLSLAIAAFMNIPCQAQYRINKTIYNYRAYSHQAGDPYNPVVAGVASSLMPGLGQVTSHEVVRGLVFLGGFAGCGVIFGVGVGMSAEDYNTGGTGSRGSGAKAAGAVGIIAVYFWGIFDAVRVAKVNNLAFRYKNKIPYNLQIQPYLNTTFYNHIGSLPAGLTLKIRF